MKTSSLMAGVMILATVALAFFPARPLPAQTQVDGLRQYIYLVRLVPRLHDEKAWTPQDREIARAHFERLKSAAEHGPVIVAGRTEEPAAKTFGVIIFEAPDKSAARAFMENDPAVKAGLMTAELHPYLLAAQRHTAGSGVSTENQERR